MVFYDYSKIFIVFNEVKIYELFRIKSPCSPNGS